MRINILLDFYLEENDSYLKIIFIIVHVVNYKNN